MFDKLTGLRHILCFFFHLLSTLGTSHSFVPSGGTNKMRSACAIATRRTLTITGRRTSLPFSTNALASFSHRTSPHIRNTTTSSKPKSSSRYFSNSPQSSESTGETYTTGIANTPLGQPEGAPLLTGLHIHTIPARGDDHSLTVYSPVEPDSDAAPARRRRPVLLLHGRTWSCVPVYHFQGGTHHDDDNRSLLDSLMTASDDIIPYAVDFRGFGGTPSDESEAVTPRRCVEDTVTVLEWIAARHPEDEAPVLFGWSQGALVAQLVGQKYPSMMRKLILYGSIYDSEVVYPREPLFVTEEKGERDVVCNTYDGAVEDFTLEGSITPEAARWFGENALFCDPVKARWRSLHEFNECEPGRVKVPTLVVAGDQDPYAPLRVQADLFLNLGRGRDRMWSVMTGVDHAIHMLETRDKFIKIIADYVESH